MMGDYTNSARSWSIRTIIVGLMLLGVGGSGGVGGPGGAAADDGGDAALLGRLDRMLAAGAMAPAAALADSALEHQAVAPRNVWRVQERLAVALTGSGRPGAAVAPLEDALRTAPREPSLHLNLARALRAVGQGGRAVAEYGSAVQLAPDRVDWRLEYAEALRALGIRRDALAQIRQARRRCGDCLPALRAEANHHLAFGAAAAAIAPLRALLAVDPDPAVRALLVRALGAAGEAQAVQALLDTVPPARLSMAEALALARADRRTGQAARARALARDQRPLPAGQPPAELWALVAETCQAAGEPRLALVAIDRALARAPERAILHHNRAAILVDLGREEEARAALATARRLDPQLEEGRP
jgi:tetratricopeptide (TPR) repeat protein